MVDEERLSVYLNNFFIDTPMAQDAGYVDIPLIGLYSVFKITNKKNKIVMNHFLEKYLAENKYDFDFVDLSNSEGTTIYPSKSLLESIGLVDMKFYRIYLKNEVSKIAKEELVFKANTLLSQYNRNNRQTLAWIGIIVILGLISFVTLFIK